ncbi:hypothetical protein OG404_23900 [Streptomyces griseoaurantiacus]
MCESGDSPGRRGGGKTSVVAGGDRMMTASASPGVRPRRSGGSSSPTPEAPSPPPPPAATPSPCVLAADGSYAARLTLRGGARHAERWTLDGPEPYAVPLPTDRPEEPGTEVLPLTDGRVLVHRVEPAAPGARHLFSLLYPTGPGTGELALGSVECADPGTVLRLLPPSPAGTRAYALAAGPDSTAVWLIAGGDFGPEHLAEVPGHCSGGVWLDTTGRMLALDRTRDGRTKTVVVDLERGGEMSPLLQIAEDSDDRLLLADADSGLLLIRSDAPSPGRERLGWGVLGSTLPVRFPQCLRVEGCTVTPFAIQPGQILTPEACAVALRVDGAGGSWLGLWRPAERRLEHVPAPEGWLPGTGRWTREGELHLPCATPAAPCSVARLTAPVARPAPPVAEASQRRNSSSSAEGGEGPAHDPESEAREGGGAPPETAAPAPRPVPLQQAPLGVKRPPEAPRRPPREGESEPSSTGLLRAARHVVLAAAVTDAR